MTIQIMNLVKSGLPEGSSINEFDDLGISNSNLVFMGEMEFNGLFGYETISTRLIKKFGQESMLSAYAKRQGNLPTPGQYPESLTEAKKFADAIHEKFPGKLLAYNCSPSFNWKKHLSDDEIASFQQEIAKMGYKFQFITLAGFHTQNIAIFELAEKYKEEGMTAYSRIQQQEFSREKDGYTSVKHQREVGTSYFDAVSNTISSGKSSTTAMAGSTESEQF